MHSAHGRPTSAGSGKQKIGRRTWTGVDGSADRSLTVGDGVATDSAFRFVNGRAGKMVEMTVDELAEGEQAPFFGRRDTDVYANFTFTIHRKRFIVSVRKRQPPRDSDGPFDDPTTPEGNAGRKH